MVENDPFRFGNTINMTAQHASFPLSGVIGVVDESAAQVALACERQLRCIEVRADLLFSSGVSEQGILDIITAANKAGLVTLYTLRHENQGGAFTQDEATRVALCAKALEAGAAIIDLEFGMASANEMLERNAPVILSYHNFNNMLNAAELLALSNDMHQLSPKAVKIVPTGESLAHAATMLNWVQQAESSIKRIGFTMGEAGKYSRILTLACGAPVTYAAFGAPVAPGQIDIDRLLNVHRCMDMSIDSNIVAVIGSEEQFNHFIENENKDDSSNSIFIRFDAQHEKDVGLLQREMNISRVAVV